MSGTRRALPRLAQLAVLLCGLASGAAAQPALGYGPTPRALDNRTLFTDTPAADWAALRAAGFGTLVLNATFFLQEDIVRPGAPSRPAGTYLEDGDLAALAAAVTRHGFVVAYEGGSGLSAERCDLALAPETRGAAAASAEYAATVARLHAAGVAVGALHLDGPFLRLAEGSRKRWSCAKSGPGGLTPEAAARTVHAYLVEMRRLVEAGNPGGAPVALRLVVNLPNWQVMDIPPLGGGTGPDLRATLGAWNALQRIVPPVAYEEVVIDYPFRLIDGARARFRDRLLYLWTLTREANGPDRPGPALGVIVNTTDRNVGCLDEAPKDRTPFLPYRRAGRPVDAACLAQQESGPDADYLAASRRYAAELAADGALDRILVTADGTRIARHIAHLYLQSWSTNPSRNLWMLRQLAADPPGG
ncbi:hypothetical protein [Roseivivax isoporae]|uniref:Uncharacterized protein n=1 Tax=Roseivivax isoporae LMG 25204 TaxID=1449351 RepID=X7F173_9RHOB|nr:hypothetical protein [Roseivivax isoporae]ETX26488.1 hypothetical protein RISW2_23960 [Roseivivax isoporae LMG 25204]